MAGCQSDEVMRLGEEEWAADDEERSGRLPNERREGRVDLAFRSGSEPRTRCPMARPAASVSSACDSAEAMRGSTSKPKRSTLGSNSRINPSCFGPNEKKIMPTPVTFPPGRLMLATRPSRTGSPAVTNSIGIVRVAAFAASADSDPPTVTMTLT